MVKLSKKQIEIVEAKTSQPIQVLASAGSGKTRVLTERIRHILSTTKKDKILALTFTNRAAQEMQDRLADFGDIKERTWVSTIHSIAQSIIESYGYIIGLPNELHIYEREQDRIDLFLQAINDKNIHINEHLSRNTGKTQRQILINYMNMFDEIKRELLIERSDIEKYFPNEHNLYDMYQEYQGALLSSGGIDFNDIIFYAYQILSEHPNITHVYQTMYKHVCVDEAQDLNMAQYELIKTFCGTKIKSLLMVGDPNQMIYGFNGSRNYLETNFIKDFKPLVFELKENFRSSKKVIDLANFIKPGSQLPTSMVYTGHTEIKACTDENAEADWVINKIQELTSMKSHKEIENNITLESMVIIARNRFIFNTLKTKLKDANINYFFNKGDQHAEAESLLGKVLDYAIRLKLNSKDWIHKKKLCTLLEVNNSNNEVLLNELPTLIKDSKLSLCAIQHKLLKEIINLDVNNPNIRKFCTIIKTELDNCDKKQLSEDVLMELTMSILELEYFMECWTIFKAKGLGTSLKSFRNATALGKLNPNIHEAGLTLSTVHTMKGLEKDIVFLIGMCEGVLPDYRAKLLKDKEEEKNNLFVAITRAKRWLYITHPKIRMMPWGDNKAYGISSFLKNYT